MANSVNPSVNTTLHDSKTDLAPLYVEVIYALPQHQELIRLELPAGSLLQQALDASGLLRKHPEIDLSKNKLGIYGKLAKPETNLRDRDRIEIYRPLIVDPKETRKQRAAESAAAKKKTGA